MSIIKKTVSCFIVLLILFSTFSIYDVSASSTNNNSPTVQYTVHVQNKGWLPSAKNGAQNGTVGLSLRMESIKIAITGVSGNIKYKTHIENIGWTDYSYNNAVSGTVGKSLRMEAITIELTGKIAEFYDVEYRAHVQDIGWMPWVRNGNIAGTVGKSLRMEAIQIRLVKKAHVSSNIYKTTNIIPAENIKESKNLNITKWNLLSGFTKTMLELDDSIEALADVPVLLDAAGFVLSFMTNSQEITKLNVVTGYNNAIVIKYGSPIELGHSGKKTTLSSLLVKKYYNYSPSIVFTASKKEDQYIREWFDLNGDGKYYMSLEFGRVNIGDYGYYLLYEDGDLYQVPIIHENTKMKVYYKDKNNTTYLFDAADILRHTKIKLSDEEQKQIIKKLVESGYVLD